MREALKTLGEVLALAAIIALCGCSFAMRAEVLNPINRSGRVEITTSAPAPAPTPTAFPTPPPAATPTPVPVVWPVPTICLAADGVTAVACPRPTPEVIQ